MGEPGCEQRQCDLEACVLTHYGTLLSNWISSVNSWLLAHVIFLSILYQWRRAVSKECIFRGLMHCLETLFGGNSYYREWFPVPASAGGEQPPRHSGPSRSCTCRPWHIVEQRTWLLQLCRLINRVQKRKSRCHFPLPENSIRQQLSSKR